MARCFQYLDTLTTTVERVGGRPVHPRGDRGREEPAVHRFCEHAGDRETAAMYRDVIEPDERYHRRARAPLLLRFATTPDAAVGGRTSAARKTLELSGRAPEKALATAGIHHARAAERSR